MRPVWELMFTLPPPSCLPTCSPLRKAGSVSNTDVNPWSSTCRVELCPDCVMCAACCWRNRPSACRNSPERRKGIWVWRWHQVGGLPQPRCTLQVNPVQSIGVGNSSSGPRGLSRVGTALSAQSAAGSGSWPTWTQKPASSCVLPVHSHRLLPHTLLIKGSVSVSL